VFLNIHVVLKQRILEVREFIISVFSSPQQQEQDPTNLYIANLPNYMSENDLESMFAPFGQVISTRILRDNNGISRGVGFCRMESKEKCEAIIAAFNSKFLSGK